MATSVRISIGETKIHIDNNTSSLISIYKLEPFVRKGAELTVIIFDENTTNFHKYVFEYLKDSKLQPRKWLLNNIIYSLTCDETMKNMRGLFDKLLVALYIEYKKC